MAWARRVGLIAALLALLAASTGCGGSGDDGADATTTPEAGAPVGCNGPPAVWDLRAGGERPAGDMDFTVTDAKARRVPILPEKMAFDPSELGGLESEAQITPLAAYTIYLSDDTIPSEQLSGSGDGLIIPGPGQTIGSITIVPSTEDGFATGDLVVDDVLTYNTSAELAPLGLTVFTDGDTTPMAFTAVKGGVEINYLGEDAICITVDVTVEDGAEMVYRAGGTILAPVVRAGSARFLT
jgi:hypothetical protein